MKLSDLEKCVNSLESVLGILDDKVLRSKYAELLVAKELAENLDVEILIGSERPLGYRSADICLKNQDKVILVEVKSGEYEGDQTDASFGTGGQIKNKK